VPHVQLGVQLVAVKLQQRPDLRGRREKGEGGRMQRGAGGAVVCGHCTGRQRRCGSRISSANGSCRRITLPGMRGTVCRVGHHTLQNCSQCTAQAARSAQRSTAQHAAPSPACTA